jgi:hypothetical protein
MSLKEFIPDPLVGMRELILAVCRAPRGESARVVTPWNGHLHARASTPQSHLAGETPPLCIWTLLPFPQVPNAVSASLRSLGPENRRVAKVLHTAGSRPCR